MTADYDDALQAAAKADRRLSIMTALRQRLTIDLDNLGLSSRDLAALSKRLMEVQDEIDAIRAAGDGPGGASAGGTGGGGLVDAAGTPDEAFPAS